VLLFKKGKLVIKGEITIRAYPIYTREEIKRGKVDHQEWNEHNARTEFYQVR
jgi:hypothetical protein